MTFKQVEEGVAQIRRNNPGYRDAVLSFVSGDTAYIKLGKATKRIHIIDKSNDDPEACSVCGARGHLDLHGYLTFSSGYEGVIVLGWAMSTTDHKKSCSRRQAHERILVEINRLFR